MLVPGRTNGRSGQSRGGDPERLTLARAESRETSIRDFRIARARASTIGSWR